jgi:C4-dicarboxylate transporter, DctM subunit
VLALVVISALIGLILIGVPIAVSLGVVAAGTYIALGQEFILTMLPQRMYASTTSFTLLAIPFFILAGLLMNQGGITERIFRFAGAVVGHITGGLGQVNVVASLIFSGMSGAAVADAAGLGQVELKAMNDRGYDPKFSAAITAASSTIGPVFPPSIPFVIYSSITGVSVIKLFLAGVVPGLLMAIALMVAVYFVSRKRGYPVEDRASRSEIWASFKGAFLSLGTPVIIVGGILGGLFTPTEAGVVASIYAGVLAIVVYGEVTWREVPQILWETLRHTIRVMFVIATAGFFGWLLIHQRIPDQIIIGLTDLAGNKYAVLAIVVAILLILGMFLEGIAVIVLTVPLFLPLAMKFGVDPVQFGVIMIMTSMLGLLTPPVGMVLYAVSSISNIRIGALTKELAPYLIGIFFVLMLVTYVPMVSTGFPNLVWDK